MEVFTTEFKDIEGRLDPLYYSSVFDFYKRHLKKCNYELVELDSLLKELYRYPTFYGITFKKQGVPVLKISNINDSGFLEPLNNKNFDFIDGVVSNKFPRTILKEGDLVMAVRGATIGKVAYVTKEFENANINANLIRISLDNGKIMPFYLWVFLRSEVGQNLFLQNVANTAKQTITVPQIRKLKIPLPPITIQEKIVHMMGEAYSKKKQNEKEAEWLLSSYRELINEFVDISLDLSIRRKIFTIHLQELEEALNPERYADKLTFDKKYSWLQIQDIGDIIRETFAPTHTNPDTSFGLIRIDDLENNPQDAIIRDVKGIDINGIILRVQKNDILIARLAPTLENKKTILTPEYDTELIASNEFICLRCKENVNPFFVLVFLKTDFYKNLMIKKSRGATPSRRRLSHGDFAKLPFPDIDRSIQDKIADRFIKNVNRAKLLKEEAIGLLEQAQKEVEQILFA